MSARAELTRYENDWLTHLRWLGRGHEARHAGTYVYKGGMTSAEFSVRFSEMPSQLRERVAARLEGVLSAMVVEEHEKMLAELRASAVEEAKATLAELERA